LKHLTEEELTEIYYGESAPGTEDHLRECVECRTNLARLEDLLRCVGRYAVPEPGPDFENRVWTKLSEQLPEKRSWRPSFFRPIVLVPALAALLVAAISIRLITARRVQPSEISTRAQARVLVNTLSEHLDRSEILLTELANAKPGPDALRGARGRARDLADENRLLRLVSDRTGDASRGALLDDLERVFLSVANAPADSAPEVLTSLQKRIEDEGLRFKVRITDDHLRGEERKL
jgi:nucleotide-binding universal stress UspA family protein